MSTADALAPLLSGVPGDDDDARIERQLRFAVEADRLKGVLRRTRLIDRSRHENSAEHSWHLALLAVLLAEHAGGGVDLLRVLRMVLLHDVVEIDAGDTFCYDAGANLDREAREQAAAARLFGLLPDGQGAELRALWEEFEAGETADARFAVALDRLQPLLQNVHGEGGTWREHGVTRAQVLRRMAPIERGAPALWPLVLRLVGEACARGHIAPDPDPGQA
jgi:5'-deoxynucleotidase YfbR-like HD superfamily hydrolase